MYEFQNYFQPPLPIELWKEIISYLPLSSISRFAQVNKSFQTVFDLIEEFDCSFFSPSARTPSLIVSILSKLRSLRKVRLTSLNFAFSSTVPSFRELESSIRQLTRLTFFSVDASHIEWIPILKQLNCKIEITLKGNIAQWFPVFDWVEHININSPVSSLDHLQKHQLFSTWGSKITKLNASYSNIEGGISLFTAFQNLTSLTLSHATETTFFTSLTKLEVLDIGGSKIDSKIFQHLSVLTRLRRISFPWNFYLNTFDMKMISSLVNMQSIEFRGCYNIDPFEGCRIICQWTKLKNLVAFPTLDDRTFPMLSTLTRLEYFSFGNNTLITDLGLRYLSHFTRLTHLAVPSKTTREGLLFLTHLTNLVKLDLSLPAHHTIHTTDLTILQPLTKLSTTFVWEWDRNLLTYTKRTVSDSK